MKIVFLSLTGNIRRFVEENLGVADAIELSHSDPQIEVNEDFIIIVPSYSDDITEAVCEFIDYKDNRNHLLGVAGSGNKNFDDGYCFCAVDISNKYDIPLIAKFEFSGTDKDVDNFKEEVLKIEIARAKQKY